MLVKYQAVLVKQWYHSLIKHLEDEFKATKYLEMEFMVSECKLTLCTEPSVRKRLVVDRECDRI